MHLITPTIRAAALAASLALVWSALPPDGVEAQNAPSDPSSTAPDNPTAHAIEFYLSDESLKAQYVRSLDIDDLQLREVRAGFFYNEQRDLIGSADLYVGVGDLDNYRRFNFRVGARAYAAFLGVEDEDVFSIGVGGEAEYYFGSNRATWMRLSAFYAPDIVTFGVADRITDVSARLETRVASGTDVYVGYRLLKIDLPVSRRADDGVHIGFRRNFAF